MCDSDPTSNTGCLLECGPDNYVQPNFKDHSMSCVPYVQGYHRCIGDFEVSCEDVGSDFDSSVCTCDGEVWVSADCTEAFYCYSRAAESGV